jgi:hypothetical protein
VNVSLGSLPFLFDFTNTATQRVVKDSEVVVWSCSFVQPAAAGQPTMWQIFLPATAVGRVVQFVVASRSYTVSTALEVRRLDVPLGGTAAKLMVLDQRSVQTPNVVISSTTGALPPDAGPVLTMNHSVVPDVSSGAYMRGIILGAGMGLLVVTQAVNVEARVLVQGVEMPAIGAGDAIKASFVANYGF